MAMSADPHENLDRAAARVEEAAAKGAQVVCLPELYRTPYFCQREDAALFDLAEPVPGPSSERFAAVARRAGVAVVAVTWGLATREELVRAGATAFAHSAAELAPWVA